MAGHSKWANIQHRKGRQDAARSKLFSKLSKEITIAAKMGDPDPEKNPRLRLAVKEAKSNSVPKDVIDVRPVPVTAQPQPLPTPIPSRRPEESVIQAALLFDNPNWEAWKHLILGFDREGELYYNMER